MEGKETYSQRHLSWTTVSHPFFNVLRIPCQELVHLACGTRPGNSFSTVKCPVVDRSQLRSNGHKRMHTVYLQNAERTRTGQTAYQRTSETFIHRTSLSGGVSSKF